MAKKSMKKAAKKDDAEVDYKKLKLKAGLEIHQQLDTESKLFCNCSTKMQMREPQFDVMRKQHPVASELGEIDIAVQHEFMRNRTFDYQVFENETCLVELDEEPPHNVNQQALHTAVEIALLLNCEIPNEIHIMRKTITDGSNTGAFQRTMVIGMNGSLKYGSKQIEIQQICLEEDAAANAGEEDDGKVTYKLNRLGVPLVEITTGILEGFSPEQIQEIAYMIGITCRSTGKVKRGIGTLRQDVNTSIRNGARVEVKGVQELGLLSKVVKKEVERQLSLNKVKHETRAANPDGTTRFSRPLPGAARMYPETDVLPIVVDAEWVKKIKTELPEPWTNKLVRFKKKMNLSSDMAIQIVGSDYLQFFEKVMKKYPRINATIVANVFTSTFKDIRRKKLDVKILKDSHFMSIFDAFAKKKILKEAFPELLANYIANPEESMSESIKKLDLTILNKTELKKIVAQLVADSPNTRKEKLYGIAMGRVRGKVDPQEVMKIVAAEIKRKK